MDFYEKIFVKEEGLTQSEAVELYVLYTKGKDYVDAQTLWTTSIEAMAENLVRERGSHFDIFDALEMSELSCLNTYTRYQPYALLFGDREAWRDYEDDPSLDVMARYAVAQAVVEAAETLTPEEEE